ncbi:MAG: nucleoside recognition domain-containing protein [Ilumatobacteraceae bacterium]
MWEAATSFLRRAGGIILITSMVLWVLLHVPSVTPPAGLTEAQATEYKIEQSFAADLGRAMEPVFAPLGFDWRINVAVLSSFSAREVFVSTLSQTVATDETDLRDSLSGLRNERTGGQLFDAPTVAAVLIFFVFALQCISTIAVMRRETNSWKWPVIAFSYMAVLAYSGALIARQITMLVT